ncbi:ADP-ribose 1''-phosphate phosphatase [Orbilia ellipsospora]|uniref:ADP-ribose 1''-phosphate phosphatase n=1 Tax=Orbilia ellipsospora TaxID=2528407 RepID=A0AAV9X7P4_9PEZI
MENQTRRQRAQDDAQSTESEVPIKDTNPSGINIDGINDGGGEVVDGGESVIMTFGDIFSAPAGSVLIHACNCVGSWGAGIALAFKQKYPAAYQVYHNHCTTAHSDPSSLLGTTLLIPPQESDPDGHWIACLFTSERYGKRVDSPEMILRRTKGAFEGLLEQVRRVGVDGGLHACKINSGRFGVDWGRTREALEECLRVEGAGRVVVVYEFEEELGGGQSSRGGRGGRGRGRGRGRVIGRGRGGTT